MMATNEEIMRASSTSFFVKTPLAVANCRRLNRLIWRTDMPAASSARATPRSEPLLASRRSTAIEKLRSRSTSAVQPPRPSAAFIF